MTCRQSTPCPPLVSASAISPAWLRSVIKTTLSQLLPVRDSSLRQAFHDATLLFSHSEVVNISNVIPAIDRLDEFLSTKIADPLSQPAIRAACSLAKQTLNTYYSKTDDSEIYRIAMGK